VSSNVHVLPHSLTHSLTHSLKALEYFVTFTRNEPVNVPPAIVNLAGSDFHDFSIVVRGAGVLLTSAVRMHGMCMSVTPTMTQRGGLCDGFENKGFLSA
jgi:hypothetical protein